MCGVHHHKIEVNFKVTLLRVLFQPIRLALYGCLPKDPFFGFWASKGYKLLVMK